MGTKTLIEFRKDMRVALGLSETDATVPDDIASRSINQAARQIATVRDWPWLYNEGTDSTVVDQEWIAEPTDATRILFVQVEELDLKPTSPRDLRRFRDETGWPTGYFVDATQGRIVVAPVPDTVRDVLIGYFVGETEASADADTFLLPDTYADWLVYESAARTAIRTNNTARLSEIREEATRWRVDVIDNVRKAGAPAQIRRTRASHWQDIY